MKRVIIACVGLGLAGCQWIPGTDAAQIEMAKKVAASELRDPSSAQFRKLRVKDGNVCGEINGRNAYGGYAGFVDFIVKSDQRVILAPTGTDNTADLEKSYFALIWNKVCG